jgi:hypothetical protein
MAVGHEATVRTNCACTPMTVAQVPGEQLPQPEPTNGVSALLSGRPTAAGSASTLLSALSAGRSETLGENLALQLFRFS